MEEENKKILVWNGISQGHKYITEEEMKDRKILQKKMMAKFWKWFGILILFYIIIIIIFRRL